MLALTEGSEEIQTKFQEMLSGQQYQIVHKRLAITSLERVICFTTMRSLVISIKCLVNGRMTDILANGSK